MGTYRYALVHEDGRGGRPAGVQHACAGWRVGDEFLAGRKLRRSPIVGIAPVLDEADPASEWFDAFSLVEPVA